MLTSAGVFILAVVFVLHLRARWVRWRDGRAAVVDHFEQMAEQRYFGPIREGADLT